MFTYENIEGPRPFLWGHRGAPLLAVENTVASFQKAFAAGLYGVEFDVQFSRDGVPFVFHDDDLKRLAGVEMVPSRLLWDQIKTITIRDPLRPQHGEAHIPTLEAVFEVIPPDIKKCKNAASPGYVAAGFPLITHSELPPTTVL